MPRLVLRFHEQDERVQAVDMGDDPFAVREAPPDALADVQYAENTEADSKSELAAVERAFNQQSASAVTKWMLGAFDTEYWCCLCFQTRAQKKSF